MTAIEISGLELDWLAVFLVSIILLPTALVIFTGWWVYGRGRPVAPGLGARTPDKADRVLMIGGSMRFPFVVEQHLPPPKPARTRARAAKPAAGTRGKPKRAAKSGGTTARGKRR